MKRVQIDMKDARFDELTQMMSEAGIADKKEFFGKVIGLARLIIEAEKVGGEILIRSASGQETIFRLSN